MPSAATHFPTRSELERVELDHAPSDLRAAVGFGLLYAAVRLGVSAARRPHFRRDAAAVSL